MSADVAASSNGAPTAMATRFMLKAPCRRFADEACHRPPSNAIPFRQECMHLWNRSVVSVCVSKSERYAVRPHRLRETLGCVGHAPSCCAPCGDMSRVIRAAMAAPNISAAETRCASGMCALAGVVRWLSSRLVSRPEDVTGRVLEASSGDWSLDGFRRNPTSGKGQTGPGSIDSARTS